MDSEMLSHRLSPIKLASIIVLILSVLSLEFCAASTACTKDCAVLLGPHPNPRLPLLVSRNRGSLIPVHSRSIIIHNGELVQVFCPGKDNKIVGKMIDKLIAVCKCDHLIEYPSTLPFTLNCTKSLTETLLYSNEKCGRHGDSKIIKLGWDLQEMGFITQIDICFNKEHLSTEYTKHILRGSGVIYRDRDVPWLARPSFKADKYFSRQHPPISSTYSKETQRKTLTNLLSDKERAAYYVGGWGPSSYLARGHLTPDADFALQTWQDATYHHINVVPQWQAFNNGNWKVLEGAVRIKATRPSARNLTIYTGTYGKLTLPDINNNKVDIYLLDGQKLPVPEYIWKVVIDEDRSEAVGFVSVNKPADPSLHKTNSLLLCKDICDRIMWVTWPSRSDPKKGIIYCCSLNSLRQIIQLLPYIPKVKLMER